jgi:hypothetical protein
VHAHGVQGLCTLAVATASAKHTAKTAEVSCCCRTVLHVGLLAAVCFNEAETRLCLHMCLQMT